MDISQAANRMQIVQAAGQLRPGTAWNYDVVRGLVQADDACPRVAVPSMDEINAVVIAYVPPQTQAEQIAVLQAQVAALLAAQGR